MKQKTENIKIEIILVISIMCVLYSICLVLYSPIFSNIKDFEVTTSLELSSSEISLAKKLTEIIPYAEITNLKYKTAYQKNPTSISNIPSSIITSTAYRALNKNNFTKEELTDAITRLYKTDLFIMNESFTPNTHTFCKYNEPTYFCSDKSYLGIVYKVSRNFQNIIIKEAEIFLTEDILFYSEEKINDLIYYKIYSDSTYNDISLIFTTKDLEKENKELDQYLKEQSESWFKYESTFKLNNQDYYWLKTREVNNEK